MIVGDSSVGQQVVVPGSSCLEEGDGSVVATGDEINVMDVVVGVG